jgi:hypothetical protein
MVCCGGITGKVATLTSNQSSADTVMLCSQKVMRFGPLAAASIMNSCEFRFIMSLRVIELIAIESLSRVDPRNKRRDKNYFTHYARAD